MRDYFEQLAQGLDDKLAAEDPKNANRARKRFALEIARLGMRLYGDADSVAWCGVVAPFDLLHAMDISSCYVEFVGSMLATTRAAGPMLAVAEAGGYSTDSCSYHRAVMGAAMQGLMPLPRFLVGTSAPCSAGQATMENLARHFDRPLFVLHVPTSRDAAAQEYLAGQLEDLVGFVSQVTGRSLDPERLTQAMELSNQIREEWLAVNALAARTPTPARRKDLVNFGIVLLLFMGTQEGLEIARTYREDFEIRVARGLAGHQQERLRLMWLQNRLQFQNGLDRILEDEHGAAVVFDELNDVLFEAVDPRQPFLGMARRILSSALVGDVAYRLEALGRAARTYNIHGAIHPSHWGCRQGAGARGLLEEGLRRHGVPLLNLEVDCVDERNYAEGQLKTRLEAFLEMLGSARA